MRDEAVYSVEIYEYFKKSVGTLENCSSFKNERGKTMQAAILITVLLPVFALAQTVDEPSVWEPLKIFLGEWSGAGESQSGASAIEAQFKLVLDGKFIEARHRSVIEPSEDNPEGEIHDDVGYISFDSIRKQFAFRQFHVEGFVNQYLLESIEDEGKTFVFVSESIENLPPGWRVRLKYSFKGEDEFFSTFELARPEGEFQCYIENSLKRKKTGPIAVEGAIANLMVEEVDASVAFYQDVLGFELIDSVPGEEKLVWAWMRSGGADVMFQSRDSIVEEYPKFGEYKAGGALILYVQMKGIDAFYEKVKNKAKITVEMHTTFYGMKEFALEDIDGYVLAFAEEVNQ